MGAITPDSVLTKAKVKDRATGKIIEKLKTIKKEEIEYAEISTGWGKWTKHPDSILFFNAVFQFVGFGAYTDMIGTINYGKTDALAAVNTQDGKTEIIKDDDNPIKRIKIKYLSKPTLEISIYKGLFNMHILRSTLQHEGRHLEQIKTGLVDKIGAGNPISTSIVLGGETWWASVEDLCYNLMGHMEADAYKIQMDADNAIWKAILLRANTEYTNGDLFIEFKKKIEDGRLQEYYRFKAAEKKILGGR